jgi:hypothetical protein
MANRDGRSMRSTRKSRLFAPRPDSCDNAPRWAIETETTHGPDTSEPADAACFSRISC